MTGSLQSLSPTQMTEILRYNSHCRFGKRTGNHRHVCVLMKPWFQIWCSAPTRGISESHPITNYPVVPTLIRVAWPTVLPMCDDCGPSITAFASLTPMHGYDGDHGGIQHAPGPGTGSRDS